jgi:hypothetical protein
MLHSIVDQDPFIWTADGELVSNGWKQRTDAITAWDSSGEEKTGGEMPTFHAGLTDGLGDG